MRKLIIGPAGSGKTHRVLEEFTAALRQADPFQEDFFFLVPSAEHTDRVISVFLQRGLPGFFHRRITTLSDLIARFFELSDIRLISSATRYCLVRDILSNAVYDYFAEVQNTPGFLNLVLSFILELKESCLSAADFRGRMNELKKKEPALAPKYEGLAAIYEIYQEKMKNAGWHDRQDMLSLYRQNKSRPARHFKKIWLDGFFDFSNLQKEYLAELSKITEDIVITLTHDAEGKRPRLFEAVRPTVESLKSLGFEIEEIKTSSKRTQNPPLVFLERHLFSEIKKPQAPLPAEDIRFFEAVGIQGEIEMTAREILRLQREKNWRFSDFAILLRQIGGYESVIRSVFRRFGIPVEIHERERTQFAPLLQPVLRLLRIFSKNWRREDLDAFLKSSYVRSTGQGVPKLYEWISHFENRAYQQAVTEGRDAWFDFWGNPESAEDAAFHAAKMAVLGPLKLLEDALRAASSGAQMKTLIMQAVTENFGIFQVSDSFEDSVRRAAASMKRLESLLDEIVSQARHREGRLSLDELAENFFRLAELDLYSLPERNANRVQVYDISLARQKEYRVVFVAGLLERTFPVHVKEDPLLSDWERQLLNYGFPAELPLKLPRQNLERYLFYLAVTRASEKLILSCARMDLEGKQSLPSFYLDEVRTLFSKPPILEKQDLSHPYPPLKEAVNLKELEIAMVGELWNPALEEADKKFLYYLWSRQPASPALAEKIKYENRGLRDSRILERDAFRSLKTSSSRLEDYAKCPYKYFARHVLRLKDPREEVQFKIQGIILHQVLENYFRARAGGRTDLRDFQKSLDFVKVEFQEAWKKFPMPGQKKYRSEIAAEQLWDTLARYLETEWEQIQEGKLQPRYFEFSFGTTDHPDAPALEIQDQGRVIRITGKIDRIDVDPSGKYGFVLDYKRSAKFKKDSLAMGTSLQLPIYLLAARKFLGLELVGAALYSFKDLKLSGFYHEAHVDAFMKVFPGAKIPPADFEKILERSEAYIRRFTSAMGRGEIPVRPRELQACDFCSYDDVCRIQKWRVSGMVREIRETEKVDEKEIPA